MEGLQLQKTHALTVHLVITKIQQSIPLSASLNVEMDSEWDQKYAMMIILIMEMDACQIALELKLVGCVMEGVRQIRILVLFDHLDIIRTMPLIQQFVLQNVEMDLE